MKHNQHAQVISADEYSAFLYCDTIEKALLHFCRVACAGSAAWCIVASVTDDIVHILAQEGIHVSAITVDSKGEYKLDGNACAVTTYRLSYSDNASLVALVPSGAIVPAPLIVVTMAVIEAIEQQRLRQRVEQLSVQRGQMLETMFELVRDAAITTSCERLLHIAGLRLMAHARTSRLFIVAFMADQSCVVWSRGVTLEKKMLCQMIGAIDTPTFAEQLSEETRDIFLQEKIVLLVPLSVRGTTLGLIGVGEPLGKKAPRIEQDFIHAYANALAVALDQLGMIERLVEQQQLQREIALARTIQERLLPNLRTLKSLRTVEVAAYLSPARHVSGDYYDIVVKEQEGHVVVAVADVCGKGIAAALLMAHLHAAFHLLVRRGASPAQIMTEWNRLLVEHTDSGSFVTAVVAEYDPMRRELCYCNAGHPRPIVRAVEHNVQVLESSSLVLGVLPDVTYAEDSVELLPGSALCLYTDGVIEATNQAGAEFGNRRLCTAIEGCASMTADSILDAILQSLETHIGSHEPNDDRTIVVLRDRSV
ncbi:MAG: serine/threonine-protein phosphatase [Chlorobi bacterium]|nr:serine/threonine-protein phosphatase [Chlorobiota bacterium]